MRVVAVRLAVVAVMIALVASFVARAADDDVDFAGIGEEEGGGGGGGDGGGADDYDGTSAVKIGTDDTLADLIKSTPVVLVEFYAPWCGHCQQLKPQYEAAAKRVVDGGLADKITLVAVDATKHERSGSEYKVQGFPTLIIFKDGKQLKDYDGGRDADAIFGALEALVLPAVRALKTKEEVDAFLKLPVSVLGSFTVPENESAKKAFAEVAEKLRDSKGTTHVRFGELDAALAADYDAVNTPVIRVRRNGESDETAEEKVAEFDFFSEAGWDVDKLSAFVESNAHAVFAEVGAHNFRSYEQRGLPFVWIFLDHAAGTDDQATATRALVKSVAKQYVGKFSFVWLRGAEYKDHWQQLGVSTLPGCSLTTKENKKYVYGGSLTDAVALKAFVDDFLGDKLQPFLKSEPVPEKNDGGVKVLVGKNFDDLVYNSGNDVLIEFYAPWCGHCQQLAPVWQKLGDALKDVKGLTIAKMDATANDVSSTLIEGFPTIYFHKAGTSSMVAENLYQGSRTFQGFVAFLAKHSSAKLPEDLGRAVNHKDVRAFLEALTAAGTDQVAVAEAMKLFKGYVPKDLMTIVNEHESAPAASEGGNDAGGANGDDENGDADDGDDALGGGGDDEPFQEDAAAAAAGNNKDEL